MATKKKPVKKKRSGKIPKTKPRTVVKKGILTGTRDVKPDRYKEMDRENKSPISVRTRKRNKNVNAATKAFKKKMRTKIDNLKMSAKVAKEMNKAVPKKKTKKKK